MPVGPGKRGAEDLLAVLPFVLVSVVVDVGGVLGLRPQYLARALRHVVQLLALFLLLAALLLVGLGLLLLLFLILCRLPELQVGLCEHGRRRGDRGAKRDGGGPG